MLRKHIGTQCREALTARGRNRAARREASEGADANHLEMREAVVSRHAMIFGEPMAPGCENRIVHGGRKPRARENRIFFHRRETPERVAMIHCDTGEAPDRLAVIQCDTG